MCPRGSNPALLRGRSARPLEVTSGIFSFAKSWKCASRQLGGVRAMSGSLVLQASSLSATDVRGGGEASEIGARAETFSFKADCAQAPGPQGAHVPSIWARGALNP